MDIRHRQDDKMSGPSRSNGTESIISTLVDLSANLMGNAIKTAGRVLLSAIIFSQMATAGAPEIRVLSAIGMRQVMLDLGPKFERATGHKVAIRFDSGGLIAGRLQKGETVDDVMVPRAEIEGLERAGKVVKGTSADLAKSIVGVAVRKGAPKPDISSVEAFKQTLLSAKSIARANPAMLGSSGVHIAKVLDRLGIADEVNAKTVFGKGVGNVGQRVAEGEAEIAIHQMQELLAVPGIEIVGPLPADLQETFVFSAAIVVGAKEPAEGKALIDFLRTPDAMSVIKAKGMDPIPKQE